MYKDIPINPWANPTAWHLDFILGSCRVTTFGNSGIGKNMDGLFDIYPEIAGINSAAAPRKAGSCSFHNGQPNVLSDEYAKTLKAGDALRNDAENPLIYDSANSGV